MEMKSMPIRDPETISVREAAKRLGINVVTVRRGIDNGQIPGNKICGIYVIPRRAFNSWLECGRVSLPESMHKEISTLVTQCINDAMKNMKVSITSL
jgi:excisionase family DNA binding protein